MTPAKRALAEAAAAETARIYARTLREQEATMRATLAEFTNTPDQIAERRRIALGINTEARHLRSVS